MKSKNYSLKKIIFLSSDVSVEDELNSRNQKIEKNEVDIIVATQLISKGFNFPDLNCIVVVNSDNIFLVVILEVLKRIINYCTNYQVEQADLKITL